jgi:hypothetical protein
VKSQNTKEISVVSFGSLRTVDPIQEFRGFRLRENHEERDADNVKHEVTKSNYEPLDHKEIWTVDLASIELGFMFWKKGAS